MTGFDFMLKLAHTIFVEFLVPAGWPIAAISIALAYRRELKELLGRATELGPTGLKAVAPQQSTAVASPTVTLEDSRLEASESAFLNAAEAAITKEVAERGWDKIGEKALIGRLIRSVAIANAREAFARVELTIYGSQASFLQALHLDGDKTRDQAMPFYRLFEERAGEPQPDGFAEWVLYLANRSLIRVEQGIYTITPFGKDFIAAWCQERGLRPENFRL